MRLWQQLLYVIPSALVLILGQETGSGAQASAQSLASDQGLRFYSAGKYGKSFACFTEAVVRDPNDALSRYYLANSLVHLGRHREAMREYEISYRLAPDGPVAEYCRSALAAYGKPVALAEAIGKQAGTLTAIRRQAQIEKERVYGIERSHSSREMELVDREIARIEAQTKADINRILNPPTRMALMQILVRNPELSDDPIVKIWLNPLMQDLQTQRDFQKEKIEEVKKAAIEQENELRAGVKLKLSQFQKETAEHHAKLDESAANLESQLTVTGAAPTLLKAEGTGLFVRYYGPIGQSRKGGDYHAAVARILTPRRAGAKMPAFAAGRLLQEQKETRAVVLKSQAQKPTQDN